MEAKIAKLREKIAEARHNEQIGWGAVGVAIVIVIALTIVQLRIATRNVVLTSSSFSTINHIFVNIGMGLFILAAILVMLGVVVSIYSRYRRTKLLKELENIED
jgi:hypothetical protein